MTLFRRILFWLCVWTSVVLAVMHVFSMQKELPGGCEPFIPEAHWESLRENQ